MIGMIRQRFRNYPIRGKLTLILGATNIMALLVAAIIYMAFEWSAVRQEMGRMLTVLTDEISLHVTAALSFRDEVTARETLSGLRADPHVMWGILYDKDGEPFADYRRDSDAGTGLLQIPADGLQFLSDSVILVRPVLLNDRRIGSVVVESDLGILHRRLFLLSAIVGVAIGAALLVAMIVSARMQRAISHPILTLVHAARRITQNKDYSVRAPSSGGGDEVGQLTSAFNQMLDGIQERDAALRASESRFGTVFQASPIGITISSLLDNRIMDVNESFAALCGFSRDEMIGRTASELKIWEYPQDRQRLLKKLHETGRITEVKVLLRRRNGEIVNAILSEELIEVAKEKCVLSLIRDVTEQSKLESQLLRSQRLDSIGRLAGGIAHDLNNILTPILMAAPVLREGLGSVETTELANTIESSARRGADIIRQLLSFSRGVPVQRVPLKVGAVLMDMMSIMKETFPKNIAMRLDLGDGIPLIKGDFTQLHQVIMNLCVNARDAMPTGGSLFLKVESVNVDESLAAMHPDAHVGPYVCLRVEDTGTGVNPDIMDKIFDPFFTTKKFGEGTGLGLSVVLGIIRNHDGFIAVRSAVGQGACFRVYLPACVEKDVVPSFDASASGMTGTHDELILVVDDEMVVRHMACYLLKRRGYRIIEACDGKEALALFEQYGFQLRLILTDIMMPHMDGMDLIRAVRAKHATFPIVVMSGYPPESELFRQAGLTGDDFLAKPFTPSSLFQITERMLRPVETGAESGKT